MQLTATLRSTLLQLAASKKVVTSATTLVTAVLCALLLPLAQSKGLPLTEEMVTNIVLGVLGLGGATVVGQGLQDKGKDAAVIEAISADPTVPTTHGLRAAGLLGFSNDTLITLGAQGLVGSIKNEKARGKVRAVAAQVTKESLIAYGYDPEFMKVVRPFWPVI